EVVCVVIERVELDRPLSRGNGVLPATEVLIGAGQVKLPERWNADPFGPGEQFAIVLQAAVDVRNRNRNFIFLGSVRVGFFEGRLGDVSVPKKCPGLSGEKGRLHYAWQDHLCEFEVAQCEGVIFRRQRSDPPAEMAEDKAPNVGLASA